MSENDPVEVIIRAVLATWDPRSNLHAVLRDAVERGRGLGRANERFDITDWLRAIAPTVGEVYPDWLAARLDRGEHVSKDPP